MSVSSTNQKPRIIIGISGASGAAYGVRLLQALRELGCESHAVITKAGEMTLGYELKMKRGEFAALADNLYAVGDIAAPIASGSFRTLGMIVAPCSVHSMSQIATGVTENLLTRAADVCLKERRKLVLMVRETPLHVGHLRSLTQLAEMGAIIAPPLPAFYAEPKTISDLVDYSVGRVLDLFGFDWPIKRWGEGLAKSRRKAKS
jgi:4-hydroxy-3-polyprenylbenzoate decarboxylase